MGKAGKFGPEGAWTAPEGAGGDAPETAEASGERPAPSRRGDPPALLLSGRRAQRPTGRLGGDRQGLRPLGASRQHPARLFRRLGNVRLLAAPPGARPRRRPIPRRSGSISRLKSSGAGPSFRSPPSSGGCRESPGATASWASHWTSATAISPPCWRASAAGTPARLQKAAIFADELLAMLATLEMDLSGLRDRAILAIGFAGGLRRSEIVGLDCGPDQTEDGAGWIEIFPEGALLTIRGKTGWREVEIGRGSRSETCPVALLETWLRLGRIARGPLFRAVTRKNGGVGSERLTDKHVVRLVKTCALAAGLRGDLTEGERRVAFGGHSLRAGLASSAQIEEAHVQKHLGHASAEMTRRYQRKRDRFTINLTKAAGL